MHHHDYLNYKCMNYSLSVMRLSVLVPLVESQGYTCLGPGWQGQGGIWGPWEAVVLQRPLPPQRRREGYVILYGVVNSDLLVP